MSHDYAPTVRNVLALYRWAKANDGRADMHVQIDWCTAYTPDEARAFLNRCIDTRINLGLPLRTTRRERQRFQRTQYPSRGRKWTPEYQVDQARDARMIHDWKQRRIVPQRRCATPELQRRFGAELAAYHLERTP